MLLCEILEGPKCIKLYKGLFVYYQAKVRVVMTETEK